MALGNRRHLSVIFFSCGATALFGTRPPRCRDFTITLRHTTLSRTSLYGGSACRRNLYLTTHNIHKRQTFMTTAGFEPAIPVSERPQTYELDLSATGIGLFLSYIPAYSCSVDIRMQTWLVSEAMLE